MESLELAARVCDHRAYMVKCLLKIMDPRAGKLEEREFDIGNIVH